ncbi:MAG: hypothetical protein N2510_06905 [Ignavibacteria bacterium]|nr:hypothetical protein [Ignavibacteria bacterium]
MRTKKVKPPPKEYEYQLIISGEYDEISKRDYISFKFRTAKEFLTFPYILKVKSKIIKNTISFSILGFSAPLGELSVPGHAGYEFRFYDFTKGDYVISVEKKNSEKINFTLSVKNGRLKIKSENDKSFIQIILFNPE